MVSIWFEIWGVMDPGKKNSIFPGKLTENFDFSGKFPTNLDFFLAHFWQFWFFQANFPKISDFPGQISGKFQILQAKVIYSQTPVYPEKFAIYS